MGEVYLAEDPTLRRKVAVKVLSSRVAGDPTSRLRLLREARSAAALEHENVCAVYEAGESDGLAYVVMQYIEGETLADRLARGPLDAPSATQVGVQILRALSEAHTRGIVHRDIKPHNVMLTPRGQVKVLDFGLAKVVEEPLLPDSTSSTVTRSTRSGVVVGTLPYLSPEQARGEPVDARSDLFSLGVVLYECLTATSPFRGATGAETIGRILHVDPRPPSSIDDRIPRALDRIVAKALVKDAGGRYATAPEMLDSLARVDMEALPARFGKPLVLGLAALALIATVAFFASTLRRAPLRAAGPEADRWYHAGIEALRDGTYDRAVKSLSLALRADEGFPLAHARLAEAWHRVDHAERAKDELLAVAALVPDRSRLARRDALHLEAIIASVQGNRASAVASYRELLALASDEARLGAHLDLGGALEIDQHPEDAAEQYRAALALDPLSAAAHLRVGAQHARRREFDEAASYLDRAEEIHRANGNLEGVAEVLYQRGVLLAGGGRLEEARVSLTGSFELAEQIGSSYYRIRSQLQLGSVLLALGKTAEAREYATTALAAARSEGLENLTTQGLLDLGSAHLARREYDDAERCFEQALEFGRESKNRLQESLAQVSLASSLLQREERLDDARAHLAPAIAFLEATEHARPLAKALLVSGRLELLAGDYSAAESTFARQLEAAERTGDRAYEAHSHFEVGTLLAERESYPEALPHLDRAYELHDAAGNRLNAGYARLYAAEMLGKLGRFDESSVALVDLTRIVSELDGGYRDALVARGKLVAAQNARMQLRLDEAARMGREALVALGADPERTGVEVQVILALAEGNRQAARAAVREAERGEDHQFTATTLLAAAEAALAARDYESARAWASRAREILAPAGRLPSEWRCAVVLGLAARGRGDALASRVELTRASAGLSRLAAQWDKAAYEGYRGRPDVVDYVEQLRAAQEWAGAEPNVPEVGSRS